MSKKETPKKPPEKARPLTPFDLALAAKRGKLEPETLRGAAKLLYKQHTEEQLAAYTRRDVAEPEPKSFGRQAMRRKARSF